MKRVTVKSYSLTNDSAAKLTHISEKVDRSTSQTLERILMSMSEKSMLYHARKAPVYSDGAEVDNGTDSRGESI